MSNLSRRAFLTGASAAAVAVAMPAVAAPVLRTSVNIGIVYGRSPAMDALPYIEGLGQRMAATLFYGNPETGPTHFSGFAVSYDDLKKREGLSEKIIKQYAAAQRATVERAGEEFTKKLRRIGMYRKSAAA